MKASAAGCCKYSGTRYIYTANTLCGDTGELIDEELLSNDKMTMSAIVKKVADQLTETMEDGKTVDYVEESNSLVPLPDTHFVQYCALVPATENSDPGPLPPAQLLSPMNRTCTWFLN